MTINRKHHIELMTIKRSKKKVVLKLKKLRHLMLEMRVSTFRCIKLILHFHIVICKSVVLNEYAFEVIISAGTRSYLTLL